MELQYLFFCMYASLGGVVEAILYARTGAESFKWNEHIIFITKAGVVILGFIVIPHLVNPTLITSNLCFIACIFSYPFFHDGFYYETARRINRPDYKFSSNSKTSTADIEIPWFIRMNLFIASLLIILHSIIY